MPVTALDTAEDNALLCAEHMGPELQKIIEQRFKAEARLSALTTTFAELLRERGGSNEPLIRAMAAFAELPAHARKTVSRFAVLDTEVAIKSLARRQTIQNGFEPSVETSTAISSIELLFRNGPFFWVEAAAYSFLV
jgi:hypothetical protein